MMFIKVIPPRNLILFLLFSIYTFYPVEAQHTIRILPVGNSITQGYTDGSLTIGHMRGYRYGLKYLLQHADYDVDMVGSVSSGCDFFSDCQHAGIGGTRDQYVVRLLTDGFDERNGEQILVPPRPYLDEFQPDIILLHIGTNDITHEGTDAISDQKISEILNLVDQYEVRSGKVAMVFLALIINRKKPWNPGSPAEITSSFNNSIKTMAQSRIANGDNLVIVDMEHDAGFLYTSEDMANDGEGLHPNDLGYSKMANMWFSAIQANYNTYPEVSGIPDQTITEDESFAILSLDDFVSDIENPDEDMVWTVTQVGTSDLNITINTDRRVEINPKDSEWSGSQIIIFTATDPGINGKYVKYDSDTAVFTVTPVNDAPVITSTALLDAHTGEQYSYTFTATDPDNPTIFKTAVQLPPWLSFSETSGLLSGIPAESDKGPNPVVLRATDGILNTDQSFTITVQGESGLDNQGKSPFNIFPVPADGYLRIEYPELIFGIRFEIINSLGTIIKSKQLSRFSGSYELDLTGIGSGYYLLHVYNNQVNFIYRFSVMK